jgi:hypothetical protein
VKWGIKSTKHGKFGRNICLFTSATEAFIACVNFVTYYCVLVAFARFFYKFKEVC